MDGRFDFPTIEWWRQNVFHKPDSKRFLKQHLYEYYLGKYMICRMFMPKAIAEIGVRWGYSAFSLLKASPQASYTGFDIVNGGHGGAGTDTYSCVLSLLGDNFPEAEITLKHIDTQQVETLGGPYDFIHIDGNHSEKACEHDIEIGMEACRPGGTILVDDYVKIDSVKRAVDKFVKNNGGKIERYFRISSLTGEFILIKGKDA